jgi:hypothetical protein
MGGNPIINIDPDGAENIAVVGAQYDESAGNKLMFANQGIRSIRLWSETQSNESRTMVLFNDGNIYSNKQVSAIQKSVESYVGNLIQVNSTNQLNNYINSKTTDYPNLNSTRWVSDPISDIDIFSHGQVGSIDFSYNVANAQTEEKFRYKTGDVNNWSNKAFSDDAIITSYACRTGLGSDISSFGLFVNKSSSLAQAISNQTKATVFAFPVRTNYSNTLGILFDRRVTKTAPKNYLIDGAAFIPKGSNRPVTAGYTPFLLFGNRTKYKYSPNTK